MSVSFLFHRPAGSGEAETVVVCAQTNFSLVGSFESNSHQRAELAWHGQLEDLTAGEFLEARRIHCQAKLSREVDSLESLARLLSVAPQPPYAFRLALIGEFGGGPRDLWWVTLAFDYETAVLTVTPPPRERTPKHFEDLFGLMCLPFTVRPSAGRFSLLDETGTPLKSTVIQGGNPGDFRATVQASSWEDLVGRVQPLFSLHAQSQVNWTAVVDHPKDPARPNLGNEVYEELKSLELPVVEVLLLLEYRLESIEKLLALAPLMSQVDRGTIRANLCQFRVTEDEVASVDVIVTRDGAFYELEVRNPEIVPAIEAALGMKFEAWEE